MTATDNEFLNEYKHLDKICSEMYSCSSGVSEYISEMEEKRSQGIRCVFGWERDYQNLKHMRWLRNQLVHDEYPEECTKEDVETARHFYERVFSQRSFGTAASSTRKENAACLCEQECYRKCPRIDK